MDISTTEFVENPKSFWLDMGTNSEPGALQETSTMGTTEAENPIQSTRKLFVLHNLRDFNNHEAHMNIDGRHLPESSIEEEYFPKLPSTSPSTNADIEDSRPQPGLSINNKTDGSSVHGGREKQPDTSSPLEPPTKSAIDIDCTLSREHSVIVISDDNERTPKPGALHEVKDHEATAGDSPLQKRKRNSKPTYISRKETREQRRRTEDVTE
ncbi:hypothetical protein BJY01DRAFT_254069 [Aspergillus pseudoustus]|uniref:Uncharacterized protein n=1 Tax=Aspergillus pseudoustus TaxID=1810923 RepID=A0ABR4IVY2_9EURO